MSQAVLRVEGLWKKYCRDLKRSLWYGVKDLSGELFLRRSGGEKLRQDEFWALKDISFELHKGETLGLIGYNGAGKSTLLKLINGLIKPDMGSIRIHGRVGALIELGAGFNPVLTGRENIYVNAAILGIRKKEIDRRLNDIIDFAEIGEFIDAPVQSYSSGMRVRLGFSIASNLNPDILLIDEVLSVGDSSFRERCINRLNDYKRNGGTIIFVSHNSASVEAISDRVMLLDHGKVLVLGRPDEVIDQYERQAREMSRQAALRLSGDHISENNDDIFIKSVKCYDVEGHENETFEFGEPFEIYIEFQARTEILDPYFTIMFTKGGMSSVPFFGISMMRDNTRLGRVVGEGCVSCLIKNPCMTPGVYGITIGVQKHPSGQLGKKHYVSPRTFTHFEIKKDKFLRRYSTTPVSQLSALPPIVFSYEWKVEQALSNVR